MKKIISVFAFAVVVLLSVQSVSAQQLSVDKSRPEVVAKAETAKLTETLNLNGDQSRAVFRAIVAKEVNYKKLIDGQDSKSPTVVANKQKFDASLKEAMKKTLTDEQYSKWSKMN